MSGEHGGQDHKHTKRSWNWFDRTQLLNTSCRTSKTTFAYMEKECVCMLCYQNDLILQLLQILLVCYGSLHKHQSYKPLLADCTSHEDYVMKVSTTVWLFRGPESHVLVHESTGWKWTSSLNHRHSKVMGYCCKIHKKSQQNPHLQYLLAAVSTYTSWIL